MAAKANRVALVFVRAAAAAFLALLCLPVTSAALIVATTAADVCPAAADPCVISEIVDMQPGALLDFGTRAVEVSGAGKLSVTSGSATLRCGQLTLGGQGASAVSQGFASASLALQAYRRCSGDSSIRCLEDIACSLGSCTKVCSNDPSRSCLINTHCTSPGTCSGPRACSRDTAFSCSVNADCGLGSCSSGSGELSIAAPIIGRAESPATIELTAAGNIVVAAAIDAGGNTPDSDGGDITLDSGAASVTVAAKVSADSGGQGFGGTVTLGALLDVIVDAEINANGGDGDGGFVEIDAGRDVIVNKRVSANAIVGEGYGGSIDVYSGRDLVVRGSSGNRTIFGLDGSKAGGFGGDGGELLFAVDGNIDFGEFATVSSNGKLDGFGGAVSFEAGGDLILAGDIDARGLGIEGAGGDVSFLAGGAATLAPTSLIRVSGGSSDAGTFDLVSAGDLQVAGSIDATARKGGSGGDVSLESGSTATVSGQLNSNGDLTTLELKACRIVLQASALFMNAAVDGENRLTARESMSLEAGSQLRSDVATGDNLLIYRDQAKPPLRAGVEVPPATLLLSETLQGCPVCGNAEVDQGETCDDGNTVPGDGCSADCQVETASTTTTTSTTTTLPLATTTTMPGGGIICGDWDGNGTVLATDALAILQAAVSSAPCDPRRCDVDSNGKIFASDALAVLQFAVGQLSQLNCPQAAAAAAWVSIATTVSSTTSSSTTSVTLEPKGR